MTKTNNTTNPGLLSKGPLTPSLPLEELVVRLVGLGGTGGILARYLSVYLSSLNCDSRMVLIDGDDFQPKNAARMLYSTEGNKAEVIRADLMEHFVDSRLTLVALDQYIDSQNITTLLPGGNNEVVILTVDNHATRKLVSDYFEGQDAWPGVADGCLISGGNDPAGPDSQGRPLRGSYGNCQIYIRRNGKDVSPSLTKYHPEIANPADRLPTQQENCIESLNSVPQLLFANLLTASSICNTFSLYLCDAIHYSELAFDLVEGRMEPLSIPAPDLKQLADSRVAATLVSSPAQ